MVRWCPRSRAGVQPQAGRLQNNMNIEHLERLLDETFHPDYREKLEELLE